MFLFRQACHYIPWFTLRKWCMRDNYTKNPLDITAQDATKLFKRGIGVGPTGNQKRCQGQKAICKRSLVLHVQIRMNFGERSHFPDPGLFKPIDL